jgi:hypothetical protein
VGCVVVVVVLLRCCGSLSVPYKTSTQSFNLAPRTVNKKDGHNNISGNVSYTSMRNLEKQCRPNMLLKITLQQPTTKSPKPRRRKNNFYNPYGQYNPRSQTAYRYFKRKTTTTTTTTSFWPTFQKCTCGLCLGSYVIGKRGHGKGNLHKHFDYY